MSRFTSIFNTATPRTGRMLDSNAEVVNVADIAKSLDKKISTSRSQIARDGLSFVTGLEIDVPNGSIYSIHFENPVGSGKEIIIGRFTSYTNNSNALPITFKKGASSSASLVTPVRLLFNGGESPEALVKIGVDSLSGGTDLNFHAKATDNSPFIFSEPIVLLPGNSLSAETIVPSGLSNSSVAMNVGWVELPIS